MVFRISYFHLVQISLACKVLFLLELFLKQVLIEVFGDQEFYGVILQRMPDDYEVDELNAKGQKVYLEHLHAQGFALLRKTHQTVTQAQNQFETLRAFQIEFFDHDELL